MRSWMTDGPENWNSMLILPSVQLSGLSVQ